LRGGDAGTRGAAAGIGRILPRMNGVVCMRRAGRLRRNTCVPPPAWSEASCSGELASTLGRSALLGAPMYSCRALALHLAHESFSFTIDKHKVKFVRVRVCVFLICVIPVPVAYTILYYILYLYDYTLYFFAQGNF
jgi:hypothetical protein